MSTVDIHCDIASKYGNGIGEMKLEVEGMPSYQSTLASIIASEVVNDIIDSALDIALSKTDLEWENSCKICIKDEQNLRQKIETFDFAAPTMKDANLSPNIKQLIEGLNTISVNANPNRNTEEPLRLDIEMKKLLTEMMSPPYPIVNYEAAPRKDGVGDQPLQTTMEEEMLYKNRSDDMLVEPETVRTVEKKSRVTDLVMNSKQVLSELLMDENARKSLEEWEETNEEVIRVIELDHVKPGEIKTKDKLKVCRKLENYKILPEDIPLPPDDGESSRQDDDEDDQILPLPNEDIMDIVDLRKEAFHDKEKQINRGKESGNHGGKGDDFCCPRRIRDKNAAALKETDMLMEDTLKSVQTCSKKDAKKKKWNFGSRIWGFLKKRSKTKDACNTSQNLPQK